MQGGIKGRASNGQGRGVVEKAARAKVRDSKGPGRGVETPAKVRMAKARGGEGTTEGAARARRDPMVQAGRQGSGVKVQW